jgi:hypothetical protein
MFWPVTYYPVSCDYKQTINECNKLCEVYAGKIQVMLRIFCKRSKKGSMAAVISLWSEILTQKNIKCMHDANIPARYLSFD